MLADYIAWFVILLFVVFIVFPLILDSVAGGNTSYKDAVKASFYLTAFLVALVAVLFLVVISILWVTDGVNPDTEVYKFIVEYLG